MDSAEEGPWRRKDRQCKQTAGEERKGKEKECDVPGGLVTWINCASRAASDDLIYLLLLTYNNYIPMLNNH